MAFENGAVFETEEDLGLSKLELGDVLMWDFDGGELGMENINLLMEEE